MYQIQISALLVFYKLFFRKSASKSENPNQIEHWSKTDFYCHDIFIWCQLSNQQLLMSGFNSSLERKCQNSRFSGIAICLSRSILAL